MIEIFREVDPALERRLREYLAGRGEAVIEHDPRWLGVLESALGHRPYVVVVTGDATGQIVGYLPLAFVGSRLFGRFLVSLPYLNQAGPVADDAATEARLVERACELADGLDVDYLELRLVGEGMKHARLGEARSAKVLMEMELPRSAEALWQDVGPKVRNQVRKAEQFGLAIQWGGVELLDSFYGVFSRNMRDLGTPVYPRKLFAEILRNFSVEAELAIVSKGRRAVAGAMLIHEGGQGTGRTQVPSASALREFSGTNANMFMYHKLLLRALERGSRVFDFGRSTVGSGTYRFKKQWGAEARATVWRYYLRRGELDAARPDNPRYRRRVAAWRRLPVWVANALGPRIVCGIP